ncbi:MAG: ATP-binding protein [Lachnospiraceae bacterium]|nr:ATP-binding protein [Lachnospiraceae bacterium]
MERKGKLVNEKLRENLIATLIMVGSVNIAAIVDRIMVGNMLDSFDLAAISLTGPVICVINVLFGLFATGGNALAMNLKAKRDQEGADICFTIAILGGMAVMALLAAAGILVRGPLTQALCSGNRLLFRSVGDYLTPLLFLGILAVAVQGTCTFVRADGLKHLAVVIPLVANSVNLLLDYIFMGPLNLGIAGAGWATNFGYIVSLFFFIPYFISPKRSVRFTRPSFRFFFLFKETMLMGLSPALFYLCMTIQTVVMNAVILSLGGAVGTTVQVVCISANSVAAIFTSGIAQTMLPISSALYGEKDYRGMRQLMRSGFLLMEGCCLVIMVVFLIAPRQIGALFGVSSPEAGEMLDVAFRLFSLSLPISGAQECLRICLQSSDRKNAASALTMAAGAICYIPVLLLLRPTGPGWVWLTAPIAPLIAIIGCLLILYFCEKMVSPRGGMLIPEEKEEGRTYDFSIGNRIDESVEASKHVIEICQENNVDETLCHRLGLATEELCTNIAKYAYGNRSDDIDIFLRIQKEHVVLRIRDNGEMFNPTEFIDESGREVKGLQVLRSMPMKMEYNQVLGFNNTIVTVDQ